MGSVQANSNLNCICFMYAIPGEDVWSRNNLQTRLLIFLKKMENLDWAMTVIPSGKDWQISLRNYISFVAHPCISTSRIFWIKNAIFSFRHIHYFVPQGMQDENEGDSKIFLC